MEIIIIDAFNVIYKDKTLSKYFNKNLNNGLNSLIQKIGLHYSRFSSIKIIIVIDGKNYDIINSFKNISIVLSENRKADDIIKERINKYTNKKQITVVSSDTEVYNYAKINSCSAITSEKFLKTIKPLKNDNAKSNHNPKNKKVNEKPTKPTKNEIEEFLNLFSKEL